VYGVSVAVNIKAG